MKHLILASRNKGKFAECTFLLAPSNYHVRGMEEAGFEDDIEETGSTLMENALIKARHIHKKTNDPVMAEDSGLFVDALDGAPGIYSARYAGNHGDDEANWQLLLKNMEGKNERSARFEACLCYIDEKGNEHFFTGILKGKIATEASGSFGFGYDPVFIPEGYEVSNACLEPAVKNSMSHRAEAIAKWVKFMLER